MNSLLASLFAPDSPLLIAEGIIECPQPDCGAPCNDNDVFDDGRCRYCGDIIELPKVKL